jgi:hypothetical protein
MPFRTVVAIALREFIQPLQCIRVTGTAGSNAFLSPMVDQTILYDREQPASKRSSTSIVFKALRSRRNNPQDILSQIGTVGVLKATFSEKAVYKRCVKVDKTAPRLLIVRIANSE